MTTIAKWIRLVIFAIAAIIIVPLAVSNNENINISLVPFSDKIFTAPLFLMVMMAFLLGVIIGIILKKTHKNPQ